MITLGEFGAEALDAYETMRDHYPDRFTPPAPETDTLWAASQVQKHDIEISLSKRSQGSHTTLLPDDPVSLALQYALHCRPDQRLIVRHQDAILAASYQPALARRLVRVLLHLRTRCPCRQGYDKRGPLSLYAFYIKLTVMSRDNGPDRAEAQTRALSPFGGEERIEYAGQVFLLYA